MPIETICQGCARKLRVPDTHAGKKARCPQCGMIYIVPGSPAAVSPDTEDMEAAPASTPAQYVESDSERWQVRTPEGRVYGPVPKPELDQWYAEGRIPREASLLREGDPQWRTAAEIYPQLASGRQKLSAQQNPFSDTTASTPFRHTQQPYRMPHRGGVILTLAILGWVICPVFGPFAWAMGHSDMRAIQTGRMDPAGQSLTQAGMILGMIETILVGLGVVFMCLGSLA